MGRVFADYSGGVPKPAALVGAKVSGLWRYVGTPGHPKNLTPAEYHSARAAGLLVFGVYELSTGDWAGGQAAGERNAVAARADFTRCGAGETDWLGLAVDTHVVVPSSLTTARAYQRGAHTVLGASTACYGPVELIHAVRGDGTAAVRWQWGHEPAAGNPDAVHYWQRNENGAFGPSQQVIGGVLCDISDELIRPVGSSPPVKPPAKGKPMSVLSGEWSAGHQQVHKIVCPVGSASKGGVSSAVFSLASGFESGASGIIWVIARTAAGGPSYVVNAVPFTLALDVRSSWVLPDGADQVSVQLTSKAPVGWCLETLPA